MERMDGRSLFDVIAAEGPLRPRDAARVGSEVLSALSRGHRSGRVHGDVSPASVRVEHGGRAALTDFGDTPFEGVPGYLAPERVGGRPPGPESDLWSLGATLYTAVEGQPPFPHPQAAEDGAPPPLRHAGPLAPVIESLLRRDPSQRPSAEWTRHMLDRVTAGFTVGPATADALPQRTATVSPLVPTPTGRPPSEPARPRRAGLVVAAVVLLMALIGGLTYLVSSHSSHHQARNPGTASQSQIPPTPTPTAPQPASPPPSQPSAPTLGPNQSPSATPSPTPATTAPPGYTLTTDPAGFSFAAPDGWTRSEISKAIEYSPDGGTHLLLFGVNPGVTQSSVDLLTQLEQSVVQLPNYHRISLQANTYQGVDSAEWEYTYTDPQGAPRHVIGQAFTSSSGTGYIIYVAAPEADWSSAQQVYQTVLSTFTVP